VKDIVDNLSVKNSCNVQKELQKCLKTSGSKLNVFSYLIIIINDAVMLLLKCGWSFILCSHLFPLLSSLLRICLIFSPIFYDEENYSAIFFPYDLWLLDLLADMMIRLNFYQNQHTLIFFKNKFF